MGMYLLLAWRNIWRNKRRSLISISSVLFAVFLAIMVKSLTIGVFTRMIENTVSSFTGYIQVHEKGYFESQSLDDSFTPDSALVRTIDATPHVTYTVPRIESFALVSVGDRTDGARIIGIDPASEDRMTHLKKRVKDGRYLRADDSGILLGKELAKHLQVSVGDTIVLLGTGYHGLTAAGRFRVVGTVTFPADAISAALAYLPLHEAQYLFGTDGRLTSLAVQIDRPEHLDMVKQQLVSEVNPSLEVITWKQMMEDLVQFIDMKIVGQNLVLALIYIIVGFGVLGTVLMMTMERLHEFGMVTAIGMKKRVLIFIVTIESIMMTLVGAIVAEAVTYPVVLWFYHHPIPLRGAFAQAYIEYGFEPVLPFALRSSIFLWQTLFVVLIALASAAYPIFRIAKLKPVDAMQTVH